MEPVVTVGLDGSPESLAAARWAADEAGRRRLTLRLLHAWPLLVPEPTRIPAETDQNYWARRILSDARAEIQAHYRRRRRAPLAPRLGAVVQAAVHHARCPVAVVTHEGHEERTGYHTLDTPGRVMGPSGLFV